MHPGALCVGSEPAAVSVVGVAAEVDALAVALAEVSVAEFVVEFAVEFAAAAAAASAVAVLVADVVLAQWRFPEQQIAVRLQLVLVSGQQFEQQITAT